MEVRFKKRWRSREKPPANIANIATQTAILKMMIPFQRWDMLQYISRRVGSFKLKPTNRTLLSNLHWPVLNGYTNVMLSRVSR